MPEVIHEATEIDAISTYNLAGFTVIVRENRELAYRAVRVSTVGDIPKEMLTIENRGERIRLNGNKANYSLLRSSTNVVTESDGKIAYENGLTVTKKFTAEGTIEVAYEPPSREYGTIIIEVLDMRTLVSVDGDSVDLWPRM